jgi:hypothetical protein
LGQTYGDQRAATRRAADPRREVSQPPLDPLGNAEPGQVGGERRDAPPERLEGLHGVLAPERPQPRRPQRGRGDMRRQLARRADRVARPVQIHQEGPTVVADDARGEDARFDRPQIGTGFALPDRGVTGPDDDEGEWFHDAHGANDHRHHPRAP